MYGPGRERTQLKLLNTTNDADYQSLLRHRWKLDSADTPVCLAFS